MPRKWSPVEELSKGSELFQLYTVENKTIGEIAILLGLAPQTVFKRMQRLGIPSEPERKATYANSRRRDINFPDRSIELAEFFGIMLGDGRLSPTQIMVTLGTKELSYAQYVADLICLLFGPTPKISTRKNGYRDVYFGSCDIVDWLKKEGLVHNKVALQVDVPGWIFDKPEYIRYFLRGFFDTDGSIYKLRFGIQISLTNESRPLLISVRRSLIELGFHPSVISVNHVYLTRRAEVGRFFKEINPANPKHQERFKLFWAGSPVGCGGGL